MHTKKIAFIALMVAAPAGLWFVEAKVLRGELQWRGEVSGDHTAVFPVATVAIEHTLELYATRDVALRVKLFDPAHVQQLDETDDVSHRGARSFRFVPTRAGPWTLEVETVEGDDPGPPLAGTVRVHDRRGSGCSLE